jgi:aerobic C4-dicarboxylate transport protein
MAEQRRRWYSILFVLVVLGAIARLAGFSILRFIAYIRDELLIVLGTSSSETVLPQMMLKMERAGASRSVVELVVPMGYSFNLDGTNIYMTLATLFLAQATSTHLTLGQELTILAIAMLTSKGASGVTGAGFVTLAATLPSCRTSRSSPSRCWSATAWRRWSSAAGSASSICSGCAK